MDFRAVKIILALFLLIAFATPIFRLSASMPRKAKDAFPMALADSEVRTDSTASTPFRLIENSDH
ncbi:hypothetical protein [Chryseolinea sp. T2]|uniref:hypothetical protein n=1 Tax=Chryseolinea sp. T2 TaxID=3129255 RepID=UPI003076FF75